MSPELWLVFIPPVSWILFALGGSQISSTIKGQKWIRRFVLPTILAICVFVVQFAWWQSLAVFAISCLALHLGYGDRASWGLRGAIFLLYGAISLPIGVSYWNAITPIACLLMMFFSRIKFLNDTFVWKCVEGFMGLLIGIQVAYLLAGNGIIFK